MMKRKGSRRWVRGGKKGGRKERLWREGKRRDHADAIARASLEIGRAHV